MCKKLSLVTSWGGDFGTGHIQRMLTLLWYYTTNKLFDTEIILKNEIPPFFPEELKQYIKDKPSADTDLIIRDMRDSLSDEIINYNKKIVVIDDNGPGRYAATCIIDILPNLVYNDAATHGNFIYGHNFVNTTNKLRKLMYKKDIDYTIYPVHENEEYAKTIIQLLPKKAKIAVLLRDKSYVTQDGEERKLENDFASTIFKTKTLISHFGILLYEAHIASCELIAINPTKHCYNLSQLVKDEMLLANFGNIETIDTKHFSKVLSKTKISDNTYIGVDSVYTKILLNLKNFTTIIKNLL